MHDACFNYLVFPAFTFKIRHLPVCAERRSTRDELALGVGGAVVLGLGLAVDIPEVQRRGGGLGVVGVPPIHVIVGTSDTSEEGPEVFCESGD